MASPNYSTRMEAVRRLSIANKAITEYIRKHGRTAHIPADMLSELMMAAMLKNEVCA